MEAPPRMVIASPKKHRNKSRSPTRSLSSPYPAQPHPHQPHQSMDPQVHANGNGNSNAPIHNNEPRQYYDNSNTTNFDTWNGGDAKTVASLDTHWFSTAGFSDPFPPSIENNHKSPGREASNNNHNNHNHTMTPRLEDHEHIVQITGSHATQRRRPDHEHIEFTNLSLDEDGGVALDYIAALAGKKGPATVSPSPTKGDSPDYDAAAARKGEPSSQGSWKIAPFASCGATPRKPSPLSNDEQQGYKEYKDSWGSSPFGKDILTTGSNNKTRVSWMDPANDGKEQASSPARQPPITESWWVEESPARQTSQGTEPEPQHEKVPPSMRRSSTSRYMVLEEHEKHNRSINSGVRSLHHYQEAPRAPLEGRGWDHPEQRPTRREDDSESEIAKMSAVLDGNRARGATQPYRHRGMHHFKECVRCLLE